MKKIREFILPLFLFGLFAATLGVREFTASDEARYAEIAREILHSDNPAVPVLNGVICFDKPVLGYWAAALSMKLFGETPFAARIPSMLAVFLTALGLFYLVRRFAGGAKSGLLAGSFYLLLPFVFGMGGYAMPDALFSFFLTLGLLTFYFALESRKNVWNFSGIFLLFACGAALGGAFLVKGFQAFALAGLIFAAWLIWTKRPRGLLELPWIPLLGILVVVTPWVLSIHLQHPEFWHDFIWKENIQRYLRQEENPQPFYYFIPVLLAGVGAWFFYLPGAAFGLVKLTLKNNLIKFSLCWLLLPLLFFSVPGEKNFNTIFPCCVPLAILLALGIQRRYVFEAATHRREFNFATGFLLLAALGGFLALSILELTGAGLRPYGAGEYWKWGLLGGLVIWLGLFCAAAVLEDNPWWKITFLCLSLLPVPATWSFLVPVRCYAEKAPGKILREIRKKVGNDIQLLSYRDPLHAVCWEFKRNDVFMFASAGELSRGLTYMKMRNRMISVPNAREFIERRRSGRGVLLILPSRYYGEIALQLPPPEWLRTSGDGRNDFTFLKY